MTHARVFTTEIQRPQKRSHNISRPSQQLVAHRISSFFPLLPRIWDLAYFSQNSRAFRFKLRLLSSGDNL